MPDDVKGRRPQARRAYDATRRRERALATRRKVVDVTRELLESEGFASTTIAEVARRAGVSKESVYQRFGSKAALVKEVLDVAIAGDDAPVPVADRPEITRIREEPDVAEKLRLYARGAAHRARRSAKVQLALRDGAGSDRVVDEIWRTLQAERLAGMAMFAANLVSAGGLREGLGVEHVRDVLWTCVSVEVYDLFVHQRGWSVEAYADWLALTLVASMTDPASDQAVEQSAEESVSRARSTSTGTGRPKR